MPLPNSQPCRVDVHSVGKRPETQDSNKPEEGTSANAAIMIVDDMTVIMILAIKYPVKGMNQGICP